MLMSLPKRKLVLFGFGVMCLMFTTQLFHSDQTCSEGAASGLVQRKVQWDGYDLERIGLHRGDPMRGGLSLEMVSDANHTKHLWYWPETYEILQKCRTESWLSSLPNVSVIITFIDHENISTLLHTIHSVMQRTPIELLHEIILIADNSKREDLGEVLDIYVHTVFNTKVRLYRSTTQMGLIQARLKGIRMAQGEVVVSMDSHVEVQPGWIEPLLHEIKKNPKTLAASNLDWMERGKDGVWEYKHAGSYWKTYFDWSMVFGFQTMSDVEIRARKSLTEPIESPVTIGTIFAIKKSWFTEIGEFDSNMELWGGENLDLPIRVWLCGGRVINVPCSRVAHLEYPHNRDYRNKWDKIIQRNYKKFALVWMDKYIKYLYQYYPDLEGEDVGDVSARLHLKQQCPHDFQWFLDTVFPELGLPEEHGLGYHGVQNLGRKLCLCLEYNVYSLRPGLLDCGHPPVLAGFYWSNVLELRMPMHVFSIQSRVDKGKRIYELNQDEYMSKYNMPKETSKFIHWENGPIIETEEEQCLEGVSSKDAMFQPCDLNNPNQLWQFQFYTQTYKDIIAGKSVKYAEITKQIEQWKEKLLPKKTDKQSAQESPKEAPQENVL